MSARVTFATAWRVGTQLRRDHRTLALIFVVPPALVALLGDPELLVLDEPTVGLDPVLRKDLWTTFHGLAEAGKTLLVSTHVMDEARRCDELVLMREGRIIAAATPQRLLEQTGADDVEDAFNTLARAAA